MGATGLVLTAATAAAAVSLPEDTSGEVVRAFYDFSYWPFVVAAVGLATMLYTAAFLILRIAALPLWLGVVAMAGGLAYLLTLFVQLQPEDDGGPLGLSFPIGLLALTVFVAAASGLFVRDVGRATRGAAG